MRAALLSMLVLACSPRHPTPGGLEVEGRLTPAKLAELDARMNECMLCQGGKRAWPVFEVRGECDSFRYGVGSVRGATRKDRILIPPSLGAACHEGWHWQQEHQGRHWWHTWRAKCGNEWCVYRGQRQATAEEIGRYATRPEAEANLGDDQLCGDRIDGKYRREFPVECED